MASNNTEFDLNSLVCGRLTIGKDGIIVIADEKVYQFLGNGSLYPVNKMVYEDDKQIFEDLLEGIDDNTSIIIRIKRSDGIYRWCVVFTVNRNLVINEEIYTELEIRDILSMNNRFSLVDQRANKYRNFLNLINDRFFEYDFNTNKIKIYTYKSTRSEMLEVDTLDEFESRSLRLRFVEDTSIIPFKQLCDNIRNGVSSFTVQFESSILRKGERKEVLNFRGQTIYRGNELSLVVGLISTVNKRIPEKDYYYSLVDSNLDSGTGLMNKKAITEFAMNKVAAYNLGNEKGSLYFIILDLDNFKSVNDTYGHMYGDQVILKWANTLKKAIGHRGVAGRIGGDEFLILLENFDDVDDIKNILKSVRKNMEWDFNNKISNAQFTCSIGISQYAKDALDYETLFQIADKALYIAKNKGGDRYVIYDVEKHGRLDGNESETILSKNVLPMMKTIDKSVMTSELTLMLSEFKTERIQYVLNELVNRMNIGGISVFIGTELNCAYSAGFYEKIISNANYINEENYLSLFNEYGINTINNVERLALDYPSAYHLWKNSGICSSIQVLIRDKNHLKGMISYDILGKVRRKWSEVDISVLYIIAQALGKAIAENR